MIAVRSGRSRTRNGGGFTLSNIDTATHGTYLHGFEQ